MQLKVAESKVRLEDLVNKVEVIRAKLKNATTKKAAEELRFDKEVCVLSGKIHNYFTCILPLLFSAHPQKC